MNEQINSEIRESINEVTIEGVLKEKNLEKATDNNGATVIRGDLVIDSGNNNEHKIKIYIAQLTKEGKENPAFKGMETVLNEFVSKVEATKNGTEADVVRLTGKLSLNEYFTDKDILVSYLQPTTSFVNRVDNREPKFDASGTVEIFLDSLKPEMVKGEETGRLVVKGYIVGYKGVILPAEFVAEGEVANFMENNFETKKNTILNYELRNTVTTEVQQIGGGFGKAREKVVTSSVHEIVIVGGEPDQYDENEDAPIKVKENKVMKTIQGFSKEIIKQGLVQREIALQTLKDKANKNNGSAPKNNTGFGATKATNTSEKFDF